MLTRLTPELLKATANSQPGVVIHVPPPTARDSYVQFMGNLGQLVIIAVIIAGAATISAERRAGTAVLVLTKPISRAGFVVAKAVSQLAVLVCATVLGVARVHRHDGRPVRRRVDRAVRRGRRAVARLRRHDPHAHGDALGGHAQPGAGRRGRHRPVDRLLFFTGFPLIRDHSPAGLMAANDAALRGRDVALLWPLATTAIAGAVFLAAAIWFFRRREL